MLLVTAARGNQGRLLTPKLIAAGVQFRACVQSEASAEALRALGVVDIVVGDQSDPAFLERATQGVTSIFHVGPACHPREREMGFAMIDAARAQGVGHFVFSSVLHAIVTDLVQHEIKRDIEEYLIASGLEFTILQPTNYMLPLKLQPAFADGVFRLSWSLDRRQSMIDLGDLTDAVMAVLSDPKRHAGATYELAGKGRYTAYDIRDVIAHVVGRKIDVEQIEPETYLRAVFGDFESAEFQHQTGVHRSITRYYSAHDFVGNPNVLTWLLGRAPTSFEDFVRAAYTDYTAGQETPAPSDDMLCAIEPEHPRRRGYMMSVTETDRPADTAASRTAAQESAPNLKFSHMGISVGDIMKMEDFYTRVLGFTVTDRGEAAGMTLVFLSRDPMDHHQIVLATGRPPEMPANVANAQYGASINQISFQMASIANLRMMYERLVAEGSAGLFPASHGIAWSVYAHDPEGNNLEFFVDSDWYISQPFLLPLDFAKSDDEILEETRVLCEASPGYEPYNDWRGRVARRMTTFVPAGAEG